MLRGAFERLRKKRKVQGSALFLGLITLVAIFAGPLASACSGSLGFDSMGRDLFARLVHGSRISLGLGVSVAALSFFIGALVGGLAGAKGGLFDGIIARWIEAMGIFPAVILAALLRAMEREPSLWPLFAVATLVRSAEMARLVRLLIVEGQTSGWVVAANALGASPLRILWHHILPNGMGTLLTSALFSVTFVVLLETSLSFLGLGVPTELASWGQMLGEALPYPSLALVLPPVVALLTTLTALFVLGDALRDELDPRGGMRRPLG